MRTSSAATYRAAVPVFAALGDETRLALVRRLCAEGPTPLRRLADGTSITRQGITTLLEAPASCGNAAGAKASGSSTGRVPAQRALDAISREWDASPDRLRAFVEEP